MKTGIHKLTFEEYLADPCDQPSLTRSIIHSLIHKCPRKAFYQHPRLNPKAIREVSTKFDIGVAAHALLLEGDDVAEVIDAPDWRIKAAQTARDEARAAGKIPLLPDQYNAVAGMVSMARRALSVWVDHNIKTPDLADGQAELTFLWQEPSTGVQCRIRPDWISNDYKLIIDYKTTSVTALPDRYISVATSSGLDIQDAFYRRGVKAVTGVDPDFVFMVQEIEEPYLVTFMMLDMMFQDMGTEKTKKGIKLWHECLATGNWPGYSNETYTLEPKPWSLAQWEAIKGA